MPTQHLVHAQEEPRNLSRLAAATVFYGYAKRTLAAQMLLTIGAAVSLAVLATAYPEFKLLATFISVTIAWLDVLFIDRILSHFRKRGAKAQELFDCDVFGVRWNQLRAGEELEPEVVHGAASRLPKSYVDERLRKWYPSVVEALPLPLARILCQRACFWWETSQRRNYAIALLVLVSLSLVTVATWGLLRHLTFADLILTAYAPLAPAIIWCMREFWRQKDAADTLEKARSFTDKIWNRAISGDLTDDDLTRESRQIQDALFDSRGRNPLIFNWVYRFFRPSNEECMNRGAEALVDSALAARNKWHSSIT